jgi:hypothetical protein
MNIIKMAEDERKKEEQIQNTKNNFKELNRQFNQVLKTDLYTQVVFELDNPDSDEEEEEDCFGLRSAELCSMFLFWINKVNERYQYEKERYEEELMDDPEYRIEMMAEQSDYDWGDDDEPSWACE